MLRMCGKKCDVSSVRSKLVAVVHTMPNDSNLDVPDPQRNASKVNCATVRYDLVHNMCLMGRFVADLVPLH
jgi:hypothetical protein